MSYIHRPYGSEYYEAEREVIRERPYVGGYSDYRVDEYGNRIHQHQNALGNVITEVVTEVIPGSGHHHHHHHHGRPAEYIERREERIVDSAYAPYRRIY